MFYREEIKRGLESEIRSSQFINIFRMLCEKHPLLGRFETPGECIDFMRTEDSGNGEKESILDVLIASYQECNAPESGAYLTLLFWPALDHIFHTKKAPNFDAEELWLEIQCAFLEAVSKYPLTRRPGKIATNLRLDTIKRVCRWQSAECGQEEVKSALKESEKMRLEAEANEESDIPPGATRAVEHASERNPSPATEMEAVLRRFLDDGVISRQDFDILLHTRVRGEPLNMYSARLGLDNYELLKKRRQRAKEAVRGAWRRVVGKA